MEVYGLLASGGIYDWPVIKQISWILGQVMNGIYNVMSAIGIENIGVSIIIFTIIVYTILLPLTIKQQKFSKMQAVMNPEIQKVQKKYAGKKDQVSMQKQQEEMNMVYEKYGVKMSSGCLPSLMQLVILFGLYPVVQNIPEYVTKVRNVYEPLVEKIISVKLSQMSTTASMQDSDNPMMNSMKTMTYTMPLISVVFGFTLPAGLGLYWVASAAVRSVQQLAVNKYLKSKSVEDIIEENRRKAQKKREKKGTSAEEINKMATRSTRSVGTVSDKKKETSDPAKEEKIRQAREAAVSAKPGSLTSKAYLVSRYNSGLRTEDKAPEDANDKADKAKDKKSKK